MNIQSVLDKALENNNLQADSHIAKMLGISQNSVWKWRNKVSVPSPEHAQALAELAGVDPAEFVAEMLMESAQTEGLRQTLARFKKALAAAAGVLPALLVTLDNCILCKIRMYVKFNVHRQNKASLHSNFQILLL
jgi:transcriptional regulator with XRE-family HTH domain